MDSTKLKLKLAATVPTPQTPPSTLPSTPSLTEVSIRANILDLLQCLNSRQLHLLPLFLSPTSARAGFTLNGAPSHHSVYTRQLTDLIASAPDMIFRLGQLVIDAGNRRVGALVAVEGTPAGTRFRGHRVVGEERKVRYLEQVVWRLDGEGRICGVSREVDEEAVRWQCEERGREKKGKGVRA